MTRIRTTISPFRPQIVDVLRLAAGEGFVTGVVDGVGPRVIQREQEPVAKPLVQRGLQAVVQALRTSGFDEDIREVRIGPLLPGRIEQIDVVSATEIQAVITDVRGLPRQIARQAAERHCAPLLGIRVLVFPIEAGYGRQGGGALGKK